ncbi:MAG: menaquinone-dependent protoporphyrinogen IX dehydrogenase [Cardiobacteriaceae bacterium]|nr:menaquinone-dependent protoporphyrinogen IX dehydrogenase [Cardiobacteriaceae bacterium]
MIKNKILLIYSSRFGYTKKIAEFIAERLKKQGNLVDIYSLEDVINNNLSDQLQEYQGIIIGASIRYGHYDKKLALFVEKNATLLNEKQACFYSVSILASKEHRNTAETHTYTRKFFEKSTWQAKIIGIFAGELDYAKYSLPEKYLMLLVMKINGRKTTLKERIEFTDWNKIEEFVKKFQELLIQQSSS